MARRLKVAVLISGGGTTLRNLIDKNRSGEIDVDFEYVVSSKSSAAGLAIADAAGIPTSIVRRKGFDSAPAHSAAIFGPCRQRGVDYVIMGGFLSHVLIPGDFEHRVLNTHPSLIPSFCGKGYYGVAVHRAVIDYGVKVTGCTIHFVDNQYDHGPIILQRTVQVESEDTPEMLAKRVFAEECQAYPEVLRLLSAGRIEVAGRKVIIA